MDWHKLQNTLYELDPTDPREDLAKLKAQANGGSVDVPPTKDYVAESVDIPTGSMPLGLDSIADFAALAGVRLDEKQKMGSAGQAKGKDPMPKTSKPSSTGEQPHPLKDKLVGEADDTMDFIKQQAAKGWKDYNKPSGLGTGIDQDQKTSKTKTTKTKAPVAPQQKETGNLSPAVQSALSQYSAQLETILRNPKTKRLLIDQINRLAPVKKQPQQQKTESIKEQLLARLAEKK